MPLQTLGALWLKWPYACFSALVAQTNHPGDKDGGAGFHVQNRRVFMMDGALTNCQLACRQETAAGCGRRTCFPEMRVQLPHKLWLYCWIPPTLNGNVSPGQGSMVLHMGLHWLMVVCGLLIVSLVCSCVHCIHLLVTSPNRTGSHALLIQSPLPSRAIEPISRDMRPR